MSQSHTDAKEATIDGETFRVRMLDPLVALDLEVDIVQTLGPALGSVASALLKSDDTKGAFKQLMDGAQGEDGEGGINEAAIGALLGSSLENAVVGLVDRLSKPKLREVIDIMSGATSVRKGDKWPELTAIFPMFFRGRVKLLHKWLAFAIRAQFRDFG